MRNDRTSRGIVGAASGAKPPTTSAVRMTDATLIQRVERRSGSTSIPQPTPTRQEYEPTIAAIEAGSCTNGLLAVRGRSEGQRVTSGPAAESDFTRHGSTIQEGFALRHRRPRSSAVPSPHPPDSPSVPSIALNRGVRRGHIAQGSG
ncbi:hypothetical protein CH252_25585 [Rhodococcus sp. 06-1477-1B]|nr:hypothetical protein CH252_25585 [Rhodococcus sp. 06-1477-1B]